jgi:hypothetical protein
MAPPPIERDVHVPYSDLAGDVGMLKRDGITGGAEGGIVVLHTGANGLVKQVEVLDDVGHSEEE